MPRSDEQPEGPLRPPPVERPPHVEPDAVLRMVRVPPEHEGMRLDRFLQGQLRNTSRTRARRIVERSAHTPEGRRLKASERVRGESWIALWRPPFEEVEDTDAPIRVLHEDAHLLVVDKPAPMTVHPTARHYHGTVLKRLERERPGEWLSLIHRLDRDTSGVLLLARSPAADRAFKRLLEDRSVGAAGPAMRKSYLAITKGVPVDGLHSAPLEPDPDNPLRVKMRVAAPGRGLPSRTEVAVVDAGAGYALVACELHTGRQHQIRVHLAAAGTPVVGDKLYGPDERLLARAADGELSPEDLARLELPRHALHAHRYELVHPVTTAPLRLVAPLPDDLRGLWMARTGRPPAPEIGAGATGESPPGRLAPGDPLR